MKNIILALFLLVLVGLQVNVAQAAVQSGLGLGKLLEMNRNIEGEFHQVTYDDKGKQLQVSGGVFLLAKPNQFVWDSISPYPQRIISDGKTVMVWDIDLEQATEKPLSSTVGNSPAALLGQPAAKVLPHYKVTSLGVQKYRLQPKEADNMFQTLTLSFKDNVIRAMSIIDSLDQTTVIEFKKVKFHKHVSKTKFSLKLPPDVDVIVEGQ